MAKQDKSSKKGKYRGYDIERQAGNEMDRPWFWKVLLISLLLTAVIVSGVCFTLMHRKHEETRSLEEINKANTLKDLMKDHDNVKIIRSYEHLAEGENYTATRQISIGEGGDYYCYYKVEGTTADYKEVVDHGEFYRNEGDFSYYYGLIGDDYEKKCLAPMEEDVFQLNTEDTLGDQNSSGSLMTIRLTYNVQGGDEYNTRYGFEAGTEITKKITCESDSRLITSVSESVEDEVFFSYLVEFDSELKIPRFYQKIKKLKTMRTCTVVSSYQSDKEQTYDYTFGIGTYFTVFDHDGYGIYQDKEGNIEYSKSNLQFQNPITDLTLYVISAGEN